MGHSYTASFSASSPLKLDEVMDKWEGLFQRFGLRFLGEVHALRNEGGTPAIATPAADGVEKLSDVVGRVRRWWGFSLFCLWDSNEVDIAVFPGEPGRFHIQYTEGPVTYGVRRNDPQMLARLIGFMLAVAGEFGCRVAVYDQERIDGFLPPTPLGAVEILQSGRFPSGGRNGILLLDDSELDLAAARMVCGEPRFLKASTAGFLVYDSVSA